MLHTDFEYYPINPGKNPDPPCIFAHVLRFSSGLGLESTMTTKRVNEIDLLRFLAAMSVLLFHYAFRGYAADKMSVMPYPLLAPAAKYGYLGVELFFLISGFVILMTAANGSLRSFFVSRLVRLYPAFWACCTITFLATLAIGKPRFTSSLVRYLGNMTMLGGFISVPPMDGAYWSLFVEMRFYALVALVLMIGKIHLAQRFLIGWLAISAALEVWQLDVLRYIFIADYSAFFIGGGIFFLIWSQGLTRARIAMVAISWPLALAQSHRELPNFRKYLGDIDSHVVAGIVTLFFLAMFLVSLRATGVIGRKNWVVIGALTYPLYLLHQNIGFMIFNAAYPSVNPHMLFWGTLVFILGLAFAVNLYVERRFSLPLKNALNHFMDRMICKGTNSAL